jgi:hypothetical protein
VALVVAFLIFIIAFAAFATIVGLFSYSANEQPNLVDAMWEHASQKRDIEEFRPTS